MSLMGWVGSANNMKWVGLGVNLIGWVGLIKMDPCPCLVKYILFIARKIFRVVDI